MLSSTSTVTAILSRVLDLAAVENGKFAAPKVSFRLQELVDSVALFGQNAVARGVEFKSAIVGEADIRVFGSQHILKQAVTNILSNAAKYTPSGSVTLTCTVTTPDADAEVCTLTFC